MRTIASTSNIHTPPSWLDPIDWSTVFASQQPIEVDIGCGKGAFLLWAAQSRPDHNFLGVERLLLRLRKVDRKVQRRGLRNVRFIRLEASYLVSRLVPSCSISVYHLYFPDPWPKRRHFQKRLLNPAFASELLRTLVAGGCLNTATDHEDYFRQMERVLAGIGEFRREAPISLPVEAQTDFEREFLAAGKTVFRGRWVKAS